MAEVSTFKGQFVANIFSFLFAAGKACLMPFLTIYFYYLGLSPIQTGLLLGLKSFTSVWSALCWIKYVRTPRRKRCVLVFSLIVLMLTHLAMMLMPSMNSTKASSFCPDSINQSSQVLCSNGSSLDQLNCQYDSTLYPLGVSLPTVTTPPLSNVETSQYSAKDTVTKFPEISSSISANHEKLQSSVPRHVDSQTTVPRHVNSQTTRKENKFKTTLEADVVTVSTIADWSIDNPDELLITTVPPNISSYPSSEDDADYDKYYEINGGRAEREHKRDRRHEDDELGDSDNNEVDSVVTQKPEKSNVFSEESGNRIDQLLKSLNAIQHQVFVALLVLVLVGEMFSSPTEQLTEDLWLRFLDSFEKLDKIHVPKSWASFGAALTPWAVVLLIDYLPCVLPLFQLPRIFIHFFSFEIIIALALLLSFCFPVTDSDGSKTKKWGRLIRGLRVICGDVSSFVCMFTVVVVGFVYGFINTFLFWVMQENTANGSELAMGISLTAAFGGEFIMSFFVGWIVKKLKCPISIILGLVVLCGRCLLYSFLFNPWIAVAGEAGHMLSHSIIWAAVRNYSAFRINPLVMDTSAQSALGLVYSGFGISSGCMVAGLCYSWFGPKMMFQVAAGVAGVWCVLFAIIYKCCSQWKKQQVKYTKVAQEDVVDSDASEDDWLDSAIKRKN